MIVTSRIMAILLPAVLLAGCSAVDGLRNSLGGQIVGNLFSNNDAPAAPLQRPGFRASDIAANPDAFHLMTINALGLAEPARRIAAAGTNETFESESGFTAAYQDGMLVSTHGLGFDLIATEAAQTRAALRQGGGEAARSLEVMDGLDQLSRMEFRCTVTAGGSEAVSLGAREVTLRKFTENCVGDRLAFENLYWLDGSGAIIASRQYVSPTVAYLRSNRL